MRIGRGCPLALIAGPCVMEPGDLTMRIAERLAELAAELGVPVIFKASFDKANRTSKSSYRGPGLEKGLKIFEQVKAETGLPVTTDVHESHQAAPIAEVVDLLQIPAFLARQTDLLEAAAATGRPVNVKKGQFMAPWDMEHVVNKVIGDGGPGVILTERGTTFRLRPAGERLSGDSADAGDWSARGLRRHPLRAASKCWRRGFRGERDMIPYLARAAVAAGCDALFIETHPRPDEALSDGPNNLSLDDLPGFLRTCLRVRQAIEPDLAYLSGAGNNRTGGAVATYGG